MAKGKITEIADIQAIESQIKTIITGLNSVIDKIEEIAGASNKVKMDFGNAKSITEVNKSAADYAKLIKDLKPQADELNKMLAQKAKLEQNLINLETDAAKKTAELKIQSAARRKELELEARANLAAVGSLDRMRAELSALIKEYDAAKSDGKRAELLPGIKKLSEDVSKAEQATGRFQRQVGNYRIATKALNIELKIVSEKMEAMVKAGKDSGVEYDKLQKEAADLRLKMEDVANSFTDFEEVSKSLKGELRTMTEQLAEMKVAGLEGTDIYDQLKEKAGELKDEIGDTKEEINQFASDTRKLDQLVGVAEGLAGGFAVMQGAMALAGTDSKELEQTFVKLQGIMAVLNGLKAVQNALQSESAVSMAAENLLGKTSLLQKVLMAGAESKFTIVRIISTKAQLALNAAMAANPAGVLLVALGALVGIGVILAKVWGSNADVQKSLSKEIEHTTKVIDDLNRQTERESKFMQAMGESDIEIIKMKQKAVNDEMIMRDQLISDLRKNYQNLTDEQKEQLGKEEDAKKELYKKLTELDDEVTILGIRNRREAQKITLGLMKDGLNKEIALINNDYDEKIKKAAGFNDIVTALEGERNYKIKEARKKAQEEWIKNEQDTINTLTEVRLSLMVEGYAKELENLRKSYADKITDIKNQLRTEELLTVEQKQRLNDAIALILEKQQQDEAKLTAKANVEALKVKEDFINLQLESIKAGSSAEYDLKMQALKVQQDAELASYQILVTERGIAAEEAAKTIQAINDKYAKKQADESIAFLNANLDKQFQVKILALDKDQQAEIEIQKKLLDEKKLTAEEYEKKRLEIQNKYELLRLQTAISTAELELQNLKDKGADTLEAERKLFEAKKAYSDMEVAVKTGNQEKILEKSRAVNDQLVEVAKSFSQTSMELLNINFDAHIQSLDEANKKDEEYRAAELARFEGNAGMQKLINDKYDKQEAEREKQKKKIERERAIAKKATSLFEIAIDTVKNVVAASNPASVWMVPGIIALGAMSAIAVAAQPLPKYAHGRIDGPDEMAITGDKYGSEMIVRNDGTVEITPSRPTLTHLGEHDMVIPHQDMVNILSSSSTPIPRYSEYNFTRLENEFKILQSDTRELISAVKNKEYVGINITEKGLQYVIRKQQGFTEYINGQII